MIYAIATAAGETLDDLSEALSSAATGEEKTSFIIEYLLAQRETILDFLKTILFAVLVYLIGKKIVKFCLKLTAKWMAKREVEAGVQNFVMSFAKIGYHLILIFIVAWILGIGATIVAVVGSAGLAVGLALQGSLSNLAGGVLILMLKPFKVGDYIVTAGVEGTVQSIDIFYTKLSTSDNKIIVIPNGTVTGQNITNTTNAKKRRVMIDFSVGYDADIENVREVLLGLMHEEPLFCQEDSMEIVISRLAPARVQMQLKGWTQTDNYWDVMYRMNEKIKTILQENQITML
ncbi:MAG: mechanosensitive ion channel [Clostridiaceae bacterium]|nr:mechanosensitive ion channel [Clostridiaceae bacterium]